MLCIYLEGQQSIVEAHNGDSRRLIADVCRRIMDGEIRIANSTELSIWIRPFPGRYMNQRVRVREGDDLGSSS
jgi:hypothetical protein